MIPVKICGITTVNDALLAARLGASAIGLIFYEKSPRYVSLKTSKEISKRLPDSTRKVGVFVNSDLETIHQTADAAGLDFVQLHGDESPELCGLIKLPVVRVLRVGNSIPHEDYENYPVHAFLLDTHKRGMFGGTGDPFDWRIVTRMETKTPIILSGGLNANNLLEGIATARPDAIDINSGVERSPGIKDESKLRTMFRVLERTGDYSDTFNT
ncbi:MAG: phosphoribosylanthranilate isomerase [Candidatus Neomarinimicrobiota bacterium]